MRLRAWLFLSRHSRLLWPVQAAWCDIRMRRRNGWRYGCIDWTDHRDDPVLNRERFGLDD